MIWSCLSDTVSLVVSLSGTKERGAFGGSHGGAELRGSGESEGGTI